MFAHLIRCTDFEEAMDKFTAHYLGFYRPVPKDAKYIPPKGYELAPGFRYLHALVLYRDNAAFMEAGGVREVEVPLLDKTFRGAGMYPVYKAWGEIQEEVDRLRPVDPYYSRKQDIFVTIAPNKSDVPILYSWADVPSMKTEQSWTKILEAKPEAKPEPSPEPNPEPKPKTRIVASKQMGLPGMGVM
jgi:hypothetical protein